MDGLRKVEIVKDDGISGLVQVRDTDGNEFHVRRGKLHFVGDSYVITSERQASIMRGSISRQKAREVRRLAKEKLAREAKVAESKIQNEVAA